jgi:hypothetical protein
VEDSRWADRSRSVSLSSVARATGRLSAHLLGMRWATQRAGAMASWKDDAMAKRLGARLASPWEPRGTLRMSLPQ